MLMGMRDLGIDGGGLVGRFKGLSGRIEIGRTMREPEAAETSLMVVGKGVVKSCLYRLG